MSTTFQIAELTTLAADLQHAAATLPTQPVDGPCDGLRLELGPGSDVTEIARLAAAEQGCCRFFDFALVIDGHGIALDVHAPVDAQPVLTAMFGAED